MSEPVSAPTEAAPLYVDGEGHALPVSQLPRDVREEFKQMLYRKAPLFVKMKALLRREIEAETKTVDAKQSTSVAVGEPGAT